VSARSASTLSRSWKASGTNWYGKTRLTDVIVPLLVSLIEAAGRCIGDSGTAGGPAPHHPIRGQPILALSAKRLDRKKERTMKFVHRPIRIEPAFEDREMVREMFARHAPYGALAAYIPDEAVDAGKKQEGERTVLPWFRGNWAANGEALVEGAEAILHNKRFLEAAKTLFGTSYVFPEFVVVNVNAPMPAGTTHIDIPAFHGARRKDYPLPFLHVMGRSGLFEPWRVIQAGALAWFYGGPGGNYDYWPEGLDGPMLSEQAPFGNVAVIADNDRMYHRIGSIGDPDAEVPRISASAQIRPVGDGTWVIAENGQVRAIYHDHAIRLSVVWKAEVRDRVLKGDVLNLDRIMAIFAADLRRQSVQFEMPSDPLADAAWLLLLQRTYADPLLTRGESRDDNLAIELGGVDRRFRAMSNRS
jgi:hypothetical protein